MHHSYATAFHRTIRDSTDKDFTVELDTDSICRAEPKSVVLYLCKIELQ